MEVYHFSRGQLLQETFQVGGQPPCPVSSLEQLGLFMDLPHRDVRLALTFPGSGDCEKGEAMLPGWKAEDALPCNGAAQRAENLFHMLHGKTIRSLARSQATSVEQKVEGISGIAIRGRRSSMLRHIGKNLIIQSTRLEGEIPPVGQDVGK